MSKNLSAGLTPFAPVAPATLEHLEHLERDRWPEFERELWARRPRRVRFDIHHYGAAPAPWEWLVRRCLNWTKIERVLNRHRVAWTRERGELRIEGATVFRCR